MLMTVVRYVDAGILLGRRIYWNQKVGYELGWSTICEPSSDKRNCDTKFALEIDILCLQAMRLGQGWKAGYGSRTIRVVQNIEINIISVIAPILD